MNPNKHPKQWWIDRYKAEAKERSYFQEALEKVNKLLVDARDEIERLRSLKKKPKK